jgi:glutamate-1-semialdehyde 2,1-aminomutase
VKNRVSTSTRGSADSLSPCSLGSLPATSGTRRSNALYEAAVQRLPGGNTRSTVYVPPSPPYALRGEGHTITDADGHQVIDLQGNMTALVHGHAHPAIVAELRAAVADGLCFGMPTWSEVALAGELVRRIDIVERVRFANSGTEAVMLALRVARAYTGRPKILRFEGCYHGLYDPIVATGARGVAPQTWQALVTVPVADEAAFVAALDEHGDELACVIVDLMPNRPGLVPAKPEFVRLLRDETRRRGILLLVDEVITFRLAVGGLQSEYGLQPDLVTLGKTIGGGLPIGAYGGSAEVMAVTDPRQEDAIELGGTFTANPPTMRAGLMGLRLLDEGEIARINGLGDDLHEGLRGLGLTVNGRGSLLRIVSDEPLELWWRLYRAGVLIAKNGLACISLPMDDSTVEELLRRFAAAQR